ISLLEEARDRIGEYNDNQRRSLLFALTQIRGARSKPKKGEQRQPEEEERLEVEDSPPTGPEARIAELVGEIFHLVSADEGLVKQLDELPTHQLSFLLYDYGWLRQRDENDDLLVEALL